MEPASTWYCSLLHCWFHRIVMRKMIRYPLVLGQDQSRGAANSRWKPRSGKRRRDRKEEETVFIETILSPNWETKSVISANASLRVVPPLPLSLCVPIYVRPTFDRFPAIAWYHAQQSLPANASDARDHNNHLFISACLLFNRIVLHQDDPLSSTRPGGCDGGVHDVTGWHVFNGHWVTYNNISITIRFRGIRLRDWWPGPI